MFGSQCVLGQFPDAPEPLRFSMEVDIDPKNRPDMVDAIDGALGEGSMFHEAYGYYVHGVSIVTAVLPAGWRERTRAVRNANTNHMTGHCLEAHDLAASKLAAWRDKDREFVRLLLRENIVKPEKLVRLIHLLPLSVETRSMLERWMDGTAREIATARRGGT